MKNNTKKQKNNSFNSICEGCDCDKKKELMKKINKKYMKENVFDGMVRYTPKQIKTVSDFNTVDFSSFIGKRVVFETVNSAHFGTLNVFKNNYVLENNGNKRSIDLNEVVNFISDNIKIKYTPDLTEIGADTQLENLDVNENEHYEEDKKLLIKDKLKGMFFNEEIVNADNKGKLTPQDSNPRAKSRDNIKKSLKNVKVIKGPPGRMDTPEEAKYRLATFIELNKKKN